MTDVFPTEKRSWIMSRVREKNTSPELKVRSLVHRLGFRFRLHKKDLPGKPDLVFPSRKKIIFVHGCFWHGHTCARGQRRPKTNCNYWSGKIQRNIDRDLKTQSELNSMGWDVFVVWECELKDMDVLCHRLQSFFAAD
nr:very short patch repair endonuclease [uncultured Sphaerochaeta sp.]